MQKNIVYWFLGIIFFIFVLIFSLPFLKLSYHYDNDNDNYKVHRYCLSGEKVKGIDVSYYQGDINWKEVKNNEIKFAFIRVSDGLHKIDPKFTKNWKESKDVNIIRGAYQFFRPNQDAVEQANLFIKTIETSGGFDEKDLPAVIDVEVTGNVDKNIISDGILKWINVVEKYTNKKSIIYSGPYFWELNGLGENFNKHPLWTAHYTNNNFECPLIPDPWEEWTFWQFTGSGRVNGISSLVDINVYNGDLDSLLNFMNNKINDNKLPKSEEDAIKICNFFIVIVHSFF